MVLEGVTVLRGGPQKLAGWDGQRSSGGSPTTPPGALQGPAGEVRCIREVPRGLRSACPIVPGDRMTSVRPALGTQSSAIKADLSAKDTGFASERRQYARRTRHHCVLRN